MTVALSSLRISAEMDASSFTRGAQQVVAASQNMATAVGTAWAQQDAAAARGGASFARVSREFITGYGEAAKFEAAVRRVGAALDRAGGDSAALDRAGVSLDAIYRKYGLVANGATLARQGFTALVPVIEQLNSHYTTQATLLDRTAQAQKRLADAQQAQATLNARLGVGGGSAGSYTATSASESAFSGSRPGADGLYHSPETLARIERETAATREEAKALADLTNKYAPLRAAEQYRQQALQDIDKLKRAGILNEQEHRAAIEKVGVTYRTTAQIIDQQARQAATGGRLLSGEITNLGFQLNDVVTGLALGQSPFMIMAQQGGQVYQILANSRAGVAGSLKEIGSLLLGLLTPARVTFGLLAALPLTALSALNSYSAAQKEITKQLSGSGRASGATAGDINSIAASASSLFGLSTSEAREFAGVLASTGKIGRDEIGSLVKLGHDFATTLGVDSKEAAELLGKAMSDPVRGAEQLNQRLGFMDAAMQRQINNLTEQNRLGEAQRLIMEGIASSILKADDISGFWAKTWTAISNSISESYTWLGLILSRATGIGQTLDEQITRVRAALRSARNSGGTPSLSDTGVVSDASADAAGIAGLEEALDRLIKKQEEQARASEAARKRMESFRTAAAALNLMPEIDQVDKLKNTQELLVKTMIDVQVSGGATSEILKTLGITYEQLARSLSIATDQVALFKNAFQQMQVQSKIAIDAVSAFSPAAKALIAQRQAIAQLDQSKLTPDEKRIAGQDAYRLSIEQSTVALREAQRERELTGKQAIETGILEAGIVGKGIQDQEKLRLALQTRHAIEQEAFRNADAAERQRLLNGGELSAADKKKIADIQAYNDEIAKQKQLLTLNQTIAKTNFDTKTRFFSPEDLAVAQAMEKIWSEKWEQHTQDNLAGAIKLNSLIAQGRDLLATTASGFVRDLASGVSFMDAIVKAAGTLGSALIDIGVKRSLDTLLQSFGGDTLGFTTGATTASAVLVPAIEGAFVSGATSAAAIISGAGATSGAAGAAGGAVGGLGGMSSWLGPAALVAGVGLSLLSASSQAKKAEEDRIEKAKKAWEDSKDAADSWMTVMEGGSTGTIKPLIQDAKRDYDKYANLAWEASSLHGTGASGNDDPEVRDLQEAYNTFLNDTALEFTAGLQDTIDRLNDGFGPDSDFGKGADAVSDMGDKLVSFLADVEYVTEELGYAGPAYATARDAAVEYARTLLKVEEPLSDTAKALLELEGGASTLDQVLIDLGETVESAADIVATELDSAIADLGTDLVTSITRSIFDARDESYLNDLDSAVADLFANYEDLIATGQDTAWADTLFADRAQQIIDEEGLIGESFDRVIEMFPILSGVVTESADALQDAADEVADALEKIQDGINDAAGNILEYVNGLLAGTESNLSPQARLSAAQSSYNAQLALAETGDEDAQSGIASYAEDLRDAAEAMYGSTAQYQTIFNQIIGDLTTLPAVQAADDPVVVALRDAILSIDAVKTAITNQLVTAVNAGNATATKTALQSLFTEIDTSIDGVITLDEMKTALGNMANQSALATMFKTLDTDNSGGLTKLETLNTSVVANTTATGATTTAVGATTTAVGANTTATVATTTAVGTIVPNATSIGTGLATTIGATTTAVGGVKTGITGNDGTNELLDLMKDQLTLSLLTPISVTSNGVTRTVDNNMLTALNKIVFNTWATANNVRSLVKNEIGSDDAMLAKGGIIPPHGLALVSEHSPGGGRFLRAGSEPITVSPFAPQFTGANDNGIVTELRQLNRDLQARLDRVERAANRTAASVQVGAADVVAGTKTALKPMARSARLEGSRPKARAA